MEPYALGVAASGLMAAASLPIAFGIARLCLSGVLHILDGGRRR